MSAIPRSWHAPAEAVLLPAGALAAALAVFGLFVWFGGGSPVEAWTLLFRGAFGDAFSWQNSLQRAAPLMLTALAVALPARAGLTVIGGEGALVLGALVVGLGMTRQLIVSRLMLTAAGMLWLAFLVLPPAILGSFYADVRLVPLAALAVLLALSTAENSRRWTEALVLTVALGLGAVKTVALMQVWATDQGPTDRIVKVIKNLPPKSTLFTATARPLLSMVLSKPGVREAWHPPLGYVSTYASTYGQVFAPVIYADRHKQPMLVMEKYRSTKELQGDIPLLVPKAADLVALAKRLDGHIGAPGTPPLSDVYLLVVDTGRYAALPELERFSVFFVGEGFTIFRHTPVVAAPGAQVSAVESGG